MTKPNAPAVQVLGKLSFEPSDPPRPPGVYVLQRVKPGLGNVLSDPTGTLQVRLHVKPTDARSPAQLARRAKVQQAVAAWRQLLPEDIAFWKKAGAARQITGFNAYVSAWLTGQLAPPAGPAAAHGTRPVLHPAAPYTPPPGALPSHGTHGRMFTSRPAYHNPFTAPAHSATQPRPASALPGHDRGTLFVHRLPPPLRKT